MVRRAVACLAGAVLLACWGAAGHGATFGSIDAISTGDTLPAADAITLLPDINDAEYLHDPLYRAARAAVEAALRERGMRVSESGPLTLRITINEPLFGTGERPWRGPRIAPVPPAIPEVADQAEIPLQAPSRTVEASLSLTLLLSDRTGKPLWSANASASGQAVARESIVRRLSAAAISDMGASVKRSFLLDCDRTADALESLPRLRRARAGKKMEPIRFRL